VNAEEDPLGEVFQHGLFETADEIKGVVKAQVRII
jgi:hypothetical protein